MEGGHPPRDGVVATRHRGVRARHRTATRFGRGASHAPTSTPRGLVSRRALVVWGRVLGGGGGGAAAIDHIERSPPPCRYGPKIALWSALFALSACLHALEISITTLYPWKVSEFAASEGEGSPFAVVQRDVTRVLTTILLTTTIATVYSTALFTSVAAELFGPKGLAIGTVVLTALTIMFGELLPKARYERALRRVCLRCLDSSS